jgi:hypothetical protein
MTWRIAAYSGDDGWQDLWPAGDAHGQVLKHLNQMLEQPDSGEGHPSQEEREVAVREALDSISPTLSGQLQEVMHRRVKEAHLERWALAAQVHGTGSTRARSRSSATPHANVT